MVHHLLERERKAKRKRNNWGFLKGGNRLCRKLLAEAIPTSNLVPELKLEWKAQRQLKEGIGFYNLMARLRCKNLNRLRVTILPSIRTLIPFEKRLTFRLKTRNCFNRPNA
jgi:hypothetical protein